MATLTTDGVRMHTAPDAVPAPKYEVEEPSYKGAGWVLFAAVMFGLAATLNVIWGIAAVSNSHFFSAHASYLITSNLHTWGWITIGWGALEFLAVASIWRGGQFGRWFGIAVASIGAILAMLTIPAYPFWSLVVFTLAVLVVYGLVAYGGKPSLTE